MYMDMLQINEPIGNWVPIPALTFHPSIEEMSVMAESIVAKSKRKKQVEIIIGMQFGRLTVVGRADPYISPSGMRNRRFRCQCCCGNIKIIRGSSLLQDITISCGCVSIEKSRELLTKHGQSYHPLYPAWKGIRARCYNKNSDVYPSYGGRGIAVCNEWLDDYMNFHNWALSNGWEDGVYLDRRDNDGNYSPGNCRFVDAGLSSRNTRLLPANNTSGYRGITQRGGRWESRIACDGKRLHLGCFGSAIDAAIAYDTKAKQLDAGHPLNFQ